MPRYEINGHQIEADNDLSDEEIDEIAQELGPSSASSAQPAPSNLNNVRLNNLARMTTGGALNADQLKNFASSALENANPLPLVKLGFDLSHPDMGHRLGAASEAYEGAIQGSTGEFVKAGEALEKPFDIGSALVSRAATGGALGANELEAAGHAAAGLLPFVGPAAAKSGEQIGAGDPVRGLGGAAGLLAPNALPSILKGVKLPEALAAKGAGLRAKALQQVSQDIFNPAVRNQALADIVAKQLLEKGLEGPLGSSLDNMLQGAKSQKASSAAALREAWQSRPELDFPIEGAQEALRGLESGKSNFRGTTTRADLAKAVADQQAMLSEIAPEGTIPLGEGRPIWDPTPTSQGLIQQLEQSVPQKAYQLGLDPVISAKGEVSRVAADALRRTGAELLPGVAKNAPKYSFAKNLEKLLRQRKKTGGGSLESLMDIDISKPLRSMQIIKRALVNNPRYAGLSALAKDRIGQALQSLGPKAAAVELQSAGIKPEELAPPEVWNGLERPQSEPQLNTRSPQDVVLEQMQAEGTPQIYEEPLQALPEEPLVATVDEPLPQWLEETTASTTPKLEALEALQQEFANSGFTPADIEVAGLSQDQLSAVAAADQKALEAALRTINNPTYQKLPLEGLGKTRASVLKDIFLRHRKRALEAL